MKINRLHQQGTTLGEIKHVHPFQFPDDPVRTYIKIYPTSDIQVSSERSVSVGADSSQLALIVNLEQGGIKAMEKSHRIIELVAELNVHGPVDPTRV